MALPNLSAFLFLMNLHLKKDGVRFVTLEKLVELKLASGMTASDRLKDLADVQELIKVRGLDSEFAEKLDPYVREKYSELLRGVEESTSKFE
jgi:hypothetical protein